MVLSQPSIRESKGENGYHLRLAEIMRRDGARRVGAQTRRKGLRAKGQFAGNFKNATPWSPRNEISQRILIRIRLPPPTHPPRRGAARYRLSDPSLSWDTTTRVPRILCRCQGKRVGPNRTFLHWETRYLSKRWNIERFTPWIRWCVVCLEQEEKGMTRVENGFFESCIFYDCSVDRMF